MCPTSVGTASGDGYQIASLHSTFKSAAINAAVGVG